MTAAVNSYGINAGGINGADQRYLDASLSQGANTVVTAGTVGIVSTASISQGANTVSSAAANAIVAAFAQTQGADTVVTAGTVGVVAASSLSQGADTVVTAGTVGIAAAAAVTQGGNTVSSAATNAIVADFAQLQGANTVSAAGASSWTAIGLLYPAADLSSGTGVVTISGNSVPNALGDTLLATGSSVVTRHASSVGAVLHGAAAVTITRTTANATVQRHA